MAACCEASNNCRRREAAATTGLILFTAHVMTTEQKAPTVSLLAAWGKGRGEGGGKGEVF